MSANYAANSAHFTDSSDPISGALEAVGGAGELALIGDPPPLSEHPAALYLASLAPGSRPTMRQALTLMADLLSDGRADIMTLKWENLRYKNTAPLRALLLQRYEPATVKKMLAALKRVLQEAWRLELISAEDYHRAADLPIKAADPLPRGRDIGDGEMRSMFHACKVDRTARGRRDAAMLAIAAGCALRRQEIADLIVSDYDTETGRVLVRSGKGNKDRMVYAPDETMQAMDAWLSHPDRAALTPDCALFPAINKGKRVGTKCMTSGAVYKIVLARADAAGVDDIGLHDFRRTWVGNAFDAGGDVATIQQICGHADPKTTSRYDRRGERVKRRLAGMVHVPYEG